MQTGKMLLWRSQGGQGGHTHRKYLAYLVILCFWEAVSQTKHCCSLRAGYATVSS